MVTSKIAYLLPVTRRWSGPGVSSSRRYGYGPGAVLQGRIQAGPGP